jgi:DNA-directed RNA polymerase specialized sigma24 family protein
VGDPIHNIELERWTDRLSSKSHRALLLLLEGGHSRKDIARTTGVAEPNVSRLRTRYEQLSGTRLRRLSILTAA